MPTPPGDTTPKVVPMKRKSIYDNISEALDHNHKACAKLEEQRSKVREQGQTDRMVLKLEAQWEQEKLRHAHELALIDKKIELARIQAGVTTQSQ
jgi:hypothetical protein